MATTHLKLVTGDSVHVEMSVENVTAALGRPGALSPLPKRDGGFIYVNAAHVVTARDSTNDELPQPAVL